MDSNSSVSDLVRKYNGGGLDIEEKIRRNKEKTQKKQQVETGQVKSVSELASRFEKNKVSKLASKFEKKST